MLRHVINFSLNMAVLLGTRRGKPRGPKPTFKKVPSLENNYKEHGFSPPWLAQLSTVDEGIQCDFRKDAEQMESGNQDEDEDEEENNCEEHSVSPTWEGQFNEVNEGIQYGVSWFESQLEKYPHQMPSRGKETLPDSKTKRSWKKPVVNRKLSTDERS